MPLDTESLHRELHTLHETSIVLLLTSESNHSEVHDFVMEFLLKEEHTRGIFVTTHRTAEHVFESLKTRAIDEKKVFIVDCSGKDVPKHYHVMENVITVKSPEHVKEIESALVEAVKVTSARKRFLVFDSMSAMLRHNSANATVNFVRFLIKLIREHGMKGVILANDRKTDESVKRNLYVFSDKVISA